MSVVGVSSYALVTRKGRTYIPFVRGSGFLVSYAIQSFYGHHLLTAAHVVKPTCYRQLYGNPRAFDHLGERHVVSKMIRFSDDGKRQAIVPLEFEVRAFANVDVASMRITKEKQLLPQMEQDGLPPLQPFEIDTDPIGIDEEVTFLGRDLSEDELVADAAEMPLRHIRGYCAAKYVSTSFGGVILARTEELVSSGMSGGPVLRRSNGRCVGVLVSKVRQVQPTKDEKKLREEAEKRNAAKQREEEEQQYDPDAKNKKPVDNPEDADDPARWAAEQREQQRMLISEPYVDISQEPGLLETLPAGKVVAAAFIPIADIVNPMRRMETI